MHWLSDERVRRPLGVAVMKRRLALGLTKAELAERIGLGQVTISMLELGRSVPRMDNLLKICEGLGVRPEDMLEEAGLIPAVEVDDEFRELLAVIRRLDPADRREPRNRSQDRMNNDRLTASSSRRRHHI